MFTLRTAVMGALLMAAATSAFAADFPKGPANQKEAEAQGLERVGIDGLKQFIPGVNASRSFKGAKHKLTFNPDGSVHRTGIGDMEQTGKWNFDEQENAYCLAFQMKKGYEKNCYAVFRATDGITYFDYDIESGFYAHAWRRAKKE